MPEEFNVGNPTKENIDYAFKNLIYYINASNLIDIYKEYKNDFQKVLDEINKIFNIYINAKNILAIDEDTLQNIKFDLMDLDTNTKHLNSYYAEWSLLWLEAIISLRMVKKNKGDL